MRRTLPIALLIAVWTAGCGDDATSDTTTTLPPTTTTTAAPGTPAVCGPLGEVVRAADEYSLSLNGALTEILAASQSQQDITPAQEADLLDAFRVAISQLETLVAELTGHYDEAASVAESGLAADILLVRDATVMAVPAFAAAVDAVSTFAEFGFALEAALSDPELAAAATDGGLAALRIDEFSIPECGFRFSNG